MTVADRIAVMDHGKIVQIATPAEIYELPNSRYVADFIGDINLLEGEITASAAGAARLECRGTGAVVEVNQELGATVGETAWRRLKACSACWTKRPRSIPARSTSDTPAA